MFFILFHVISRQRQRIQWSKYVKGLRCHYIFSVFSIRMYWHSIFSTGMLTYRLFLGSRSWWRLQVWFLWSPPWQVFLLRPVHRLRVSLYQLWWNRCWWCTVCRFCRVSIRVHRSAPECGCLDQIWWQRNFFWVLRLSSIELFWVFKNIYLCY